MFVNKACPICSNENLLPYLECNDHTVSHETFSIVACSTCNFKITNPRPDDTTLGKYYLSDNYISHSKKTHSIVDIIYKISRLFTLKWKTDLIKKSVSETKIDLLDYGCGTGDFLQSAGRLGWNITGIEPSAQARQIAAEKLHGKIYSDSEQIRHSYNAITLWHVLEHIPDLNEVIEKLAGHLQNKGIMFIAVPNHESFDEALYSNMWAGYDVPRHLWHFTKTNMKSLLTKHNLELVEIKPMKLDAFYVSIMSEKHIRGKHTITGFIRGMYNGLRSNMKAANKTNHSSLIYIVTKK